MKLKDVLKICYGKNQSDVEVPYSAIPILGTGGIIGYASRPLYDKESVLIGRKGSISKPFYIDKPFWTIDTLFYTKINDEMIVPKYLYYYLSTVDLSLYNEGSAVPSLTTKTLYDIDIFVPGLEFQHHIVDTIGSIDDLIEKCCEKQDKIEKISSMIFDMYEKNDSYKVENTFITTNGIAYKSNEYLRLSEYKLITIKNIDENGFNTDKVTYLDSDKIKEHSRLDVGDILITMTGNIGRVGIVDEKNCILNQRVLKIQCSSMLYLYCWLMKYMETIEMLGKGTAQKNLSLYDFKNLIVHNSDSEIEEFKRYDCLFDQLVNLKLIIKKLKNTKQLLLIKYFK